MTFNLALEEIAQNAYTSAHFGGNILATGDRLGADGTFDETAEALAGVSEKLDPVIGELTIEGTPQAEAAEPDLLSFLMSGEETGPDESADQGEAILLGLPVLPAQGPPSEDESTAAAVDDADDGGGGLGALGLAMLPLLLLAGTRGSPHLHHALSR
ncbi:hypothetical protein ROTO_22980 [Roseovarius tolerans]|uniref:Uncharacterized protein n=1 Tax=Roseovarius tolerans TaxID=74031 RepID=A0A0L6CU21_9RHOB|nr:hypothetical protein [Roseovarius tolerans]KNX41180.1 hypothetical protein ROTO_22980 [Roseovarius tolerans]